MMYRTIVVFCQDCDCLMHEPFEKTSERPSGYGGMPMGISYDPFIEHDP